MYAAKSRAYATNQYQGMSPDRLVLAMYDAAIAALGAAQQAIDDGKVARRGESTGKALALIGELQSSLRLDMGLTVAEELYLLYDYLTRELVRANMNADKAHFAHCAKLLETLREPWQKMQENKAEAGEDTKEEPAPSAAAARLVL